MRRDFTPDRDFEVAHRSGGRLGLRDDEPGRRARRPARRDRQRASELDDPASWSTPAPRARWASATQVAAVERAAGGAAQGGDPTRRRRRVRPGRGACLHGKASAAVGVVGKRILARGALGASDLERALGWLATSGKVRRSRVLLVTDGVATAGETPATSCGRGWRRWRASASSGSTCWRVGGIRDDAMLCAPGDGGAGARRRGARRRRSRPAELARRLTARDALGHRRSRSRAPGWVWPSVVDGVQPGDEVLVYADLPAGRSASAEGRRGGDAAGGRADADAAPAARARLGPRPDRAPASSSATRSPPRIAISRRRSRSRPSSCRSQHRVLCPFTALLVLETEQDYARFGIERRALADILTVGAAAASRCCTGSRSRRRATPPRCVEPRMTRRRRRRCADDGAKKDEAGDCRTRRGEEGRGRARRPSRRSGEVRPHRGRRPRPSRPRPPTRGERQRVMRSAPALEAWPSRRRASVARRAQRRRRRAAPTCGRSAPRADAAGRGRAPTARAGAEAAPPDAAVRRGHGRCSSARPRARGAGAGARLARRATPATCWRWSRSARRSRRWATSPAAARAYGSIIDLFPARADLRRFAGERLERLRRRAGAGAGDRHLSQGRRAAPRPPRRPPPARLRAAQGRPARTRRSTRSSPALAQQLPGRPLRGVERILREDLGPASPRPGSHAEPARGDEIRDAPAARGRHAGRAARRCASSSTGRPTPTTSTSTSTTRSGGHAFYSAPQLAVGRRALRRRHDRLRPRVLHHPRPAAGRAVPYQLQAHYYSRGPMGYGMGKLQIIEHDGQGGLRFEERPFVIMNDRAFVDLGRVVGAASGRSGRDGDWHAAGGGRPPGRSRGRGSGRPPRVWPRQRVDAPVQEPACRRAQSPSTIGHLIL